MKRIHSMDELNNIKEEIPILTGPGSVFIALVVIALYATSGLTRQFLFDFNHASALLLFAIPLSVFFVQIYHGYEILLGVKKRNIGKTYQNNNLHRIICMIDYLAWKHNDDEMRQWQIIYRKAKGKNLFGSLTIASGCFTILFMILYSCFSYVLYDQFNPLELNGFVGWLIVLVGFFLTIFFLFVHYELSIVIQIYDRELLKSLNYSLDRWIERDNEFINQRIFRFQ